MYPKTEVPELQEVVPSIWTEGYCETYHLTNSYQKCAKHIHTSSKKYTMQDFIDIIQFVLAADINCVYIFPKQNWV